MTFIVRTISRTSAGGEIIRPTSHAIESIGIGRDASNEVHLADLAVSPFHARLTIQPGGRVLAESVDGLGFSVDGRMTKRAEIDARRGAELRFGGHLLRLANEGDVVAIGVERTEALSDASEDKEEANVFTLKGLMPGKRTGAWTFAILMLAAFLAWPIYSYATWKTVKERPESFHADTTWSSGPLSQAHHALENDCQSCHDKAFTSVEDTKCVACHTKIHDHADIKRQGLAMAPPGVGGKIENFFKASFGVPTTQRCVDCHTEHEGAGPMPATAQAFCTDCHATMKLRLTDTKLANAGDFGTDHPQFMPNVPVGLDKAGHPSFSRVSLDAKPIDDSGLKFPHDMHLSATNGVARMAQTMRAEEGWGNKLECKDCHTPTPDGVRFQPVDMESDCQACHSLGFDRVGGTVRRLFHGDVAQAVADLQSARSFTAPPPLLAGRRRPGEGVTPPASQYARPASTAALFMPGGACYDCHVVTRTGDARSNGWAIRKVVQPMRFMQKGWFDHEAHKTESCSSCHNAETSKSARDLLLPAIGKLGDKGGKTCRSCHGGEASATKVPSGCAMCHSYHLDDAAPWRTRQQVGKDKGQLRPATVAMRGPVKTTRSTQY